MINLGKKNFKDLSFEEKIKGVQKMREEEKFRIGEEGEALRVLCLECGCHFHFVNLKPHSLRSGNLFHLEYSPNTEYSVCDNTSLSKPLVYEQQQKPFLCCPVIPQNLVVCFIR